MEGSLCEVCWRGKMELFNGMLVCNVCGTVLQGFTQEENEADFDHMGARARTTAVRRHTAPQEIRERSKLRIDEATHAYVVAMQRLVRRQAAALADACGVDPACRPVLGALWLRCLASSGALSAQWRAEVRAQAEARRAALGGAPAQRGPGGARGSAAAGSRPGGAGSTPGVPAPPPPQSLPPPYWALAEALFASLPPRLTLALCLCACWAVRAPVEADDVVAWALSGRLPYLELRQLNAQALDDVQDALHPFITRPRGCPPPARLHRLAVAVAAWGGVPLPPTPREALLDRWLAGAREPHARRAALRELALALVRAFGEGAADPAADLRRRGEERASAEAQARAGKGDGEGQARRERSEMETAATNATAGDAGAPTTLGRPDAPTPAPSAPYARGAPPEGSAADSTDRLTMAAALLLAERLLEARDEEGARDDRADGGSASAAPPSGSSRVPPDASPDAWRLASCDPLFPAFLAPSPLAIPGAPPSEDALAMSPLERAAYLERLRATFFPPPPEGDGRAATLLRALEEKAERGIERAKAEQRRQEQQENEERRRKGRNNVDATGPGSGSGSERDAVGAAGASGASLSAASSASPRRILALSPLPPVRSSAHLPARYAARLGALSSLARVSPVDLHARELRLERQLLVADAALSYELAGGLEADVARALKRRRQEEEEERACAKRAPVGGAELGEDEVGRRPAAGAGAEPIGVAAPRVGAEARDEGDTVECSVDEPVAPEEEA